MYIAELYLEDDDFVFLIAKYCIGFLYVILIPMLTLIVQKEIRQGVWAIILHQTPSSNDSTVGETLDELYWYRLSLLINWTIKALHYAPEIFKM